MQRQISLRAIMLLLASTILLATSPAMAKDKHPSPPPVTGTGAPIDTTLAAAARYFAPDLRTNSAAIAYDATSGLHAAYTGYGEGNKDAMYYARCVKADCAAADAWQTAELRLPSAVRVQLALTPSGQPRLLGTGWSSDQANGLNYWYAECNADCMTMGNWTMTKIVGTADGVMSNIARTRLADHTFALDERGNPRFMVTDSNYSIEPDHYGAFYMACDNACSDERNWTETDLANHAGAVTETFSYPALALAPGGKARVIADVYAFDETGKDLDNGLYYYECDRDCSTRANWARTLVLDTGGGSYPYPSWDLETLPDGRPRIAQFTGYGMNNDALDHQLIYSWCEAECTSGADGENWYGSPIGIGESPDLEFDSAGKPFIAFVTDGDEAGTAWCDTDCEVVGKGQWSADFAERVAAAAADRPTAMPYTCDGELWNVEAPSLALVADQPLIAFNVTVQARCLYKTIGEPEISYQFHEIWRGGRFVRVKL